MISFFSYTRIKERLKFSIVNTATNSARKIIAMNSQLTINVHASKTIQGNVMEMEN